MYLSALDGDDERARQGGAVVAGERRVGRAHDEADREGAEDCRSAERQF